MNASCGVDSPFQRSKRNLGRANVFLRRQEYLKAVEAAQKAFGLKALCGSLIGKQKIELEFLFLDFCDKFNNDPGIINFLDSIKIRFRPFLAYKPGQEQQMVTKLNIVGERMIAKERERTKRKELEAANKKRDLLDKGQQSLDKGEFPRGKSYLRRVADEYGHEPGVLTDIAARLIDKDILLEAAEILDTARKKHPKDHTAYSLSIKAYLGLGDLPKAEGVYKAAISQFGGHPQTYLNLSKLYLRWRKRDKAFAFAKLALEADPELMEARDIMRSTG